MKIWVIGKNSMLAKSLLLLLQDNNIDFIATSRDMVDITSTDSIQKFLSKNDCSHIINCSAYTNVEMAEKEKDLAYAINSYGVENIAKEAKKQGIKVLHISTDYVFDGKKNEPYKEQDICMPCNVYGQSKLEGEKKLLDICSDSTLIRTSWLFGNNDNNFISKILKKMKTEKEISVVSDQIGRLTFGKDLSEAILFLIEYEGIYHFANAKVVSWYDIAMYVYNLAVKNDNSIECRTINSVSTKEFNALAKRPLYSVLDTEKFENIFPKKIRSYKEVINDYFEENLVGCKKY